MVIAELPTDEDLRLEDLASYDILDTQAEDDFEALVELASQVCKCPISMITLVDKDRQWFKAKRGTADTETAREPSFCAHAILGDEVMHVEDASRDERFFDNPFVTDGIKIRFYAGAPIVSEAGYKLGTVCIIDNKPRKLLPEEERTLTLLSQQASKLLELRRKNVLLRKRAEEIITIKSSALNRAVEDLEQEKKAIAFSLHEELAQGVASCMLYLKTAEEEADEKKRLPLIHNTTAQLHDILVNMRRLSYSITPTVAGWTPAEDLVQEFAEKIRGTFPFEVHFRVVGIKGNGNAGKALIAIRVIEEWLKMLAGKKPVTNVYLTVKTKEQFELRIEDDAPLSDDFEDLREEVFDRLIYDRVQAQGGSVDVSVSPGGNNMLKILLPLDAASPEDELTFN